jgi:hypothetical protein
MRINRHRPASPRRLPQNQSRLKPQRSFVASLADGFITRQLTARKPLDRCIKCKGLDFEVANTHEVSRGVTILPLRLPKRAQIKNYVTRKKPLRHNGFLLFLTPSVLSATVMNVTRSRMVAIPLTADAAGTILAASLLCCERLSSGSLQPCGGLSGRCR